MADKPGAIVHVEFHSTDPEREKAFYSKVFGWKFQDMPEMNYSLFEAPSGPGGGLQRHGEGGPMVLNYLLSENIDKTLRAIEDNGGRVMNPKMEIPGYGWWALFQDPTGLTMALYETAARPTPAPRPRRTAKKAAKKTARKAMKGRKRGRRSR
jgi:predicted enzyme related to lactoylglutathione lyase